MTSSDYYEKCYNSAVLGNAQYYAANAVNYIFGGSNFFEEVKNKNSSQVEQVEVEQSKIAQSIVMGG